jgi:hypothetical protein
MSESWKNVRCACIPLQELTVLADLRGRSEIRVSTAGDKAWVWWGAESDLLEEILVRRILPLPGVELFTVRGGCWYRLGAHLPAFGWCVDPGSPGVLLERMILPTPIEAEQPLGALPDPMRVCLVRDERSLVRPASAFRCALSVLSAWAERATSAQLACLQAAWTEGSQVEEGAAGTPASVLVLGKMGMLPLLPEGVRFWGTDLLIPLGFRADPGLPELALTSALGASASDLVVLDEDGFELIARGTFKPLCRAGIRLASEDSKAVGPGGRSRR